MLVCLIIQDVSKLRIGSRVSCMQEEKNVWLSGGKIDKPRVTALERERSCVVKVFLTDSRGRNMGAGALK